MNVRITSSELASLATSYATSYAKGKAQADDCRVVTICIIDGDGRRHAIGDCEVSIVLVPVEHCHARRVVNPASVG